MYDNWSEIIAIMKTVINHGGSRAELRIAVVSDDSIEYNGEVYRLSRFVRSYLPDNRRTSSNSYRGPDYFSYKGKTLTDMRQEVCKEQVRPQDSEGQNDKNNKAIQISLDSYNTFKTKK